MLLGSVIPLEFMYEVMVDGIEVMFLVLTHSVPLMTKSIQQVAFVQNYVELHKLRTFLA